MLRFLFSPEWFYNIDSIFEFVTVIVAILVAVYSYKCFRLSRDQKYKWFSLSFAGIAAGFLAKIMTNFTLYHEVVKTKAVGLLVLTSRYVQRDIFFLSTTTFFYHLLILLGLLGLYLCIYKSYKQKQDIFILLFLAFISTVGSHYRYQVFHITAAVLLFFIFRHFYKNYLKKMTKNTLLVALAFCLLLISQILFTFIGLDPQLYVIGEVIQLVGFVLLLATYIIVLKK
ncbi:hypothetical protein KY326_01625 [Candidatus Woesearchaeota archaeon]|nr:hypothetical protein [Candidatus Woesearchaeota archaeon]